MEEELNLEARRSDSSLHHHPPISHPPHHNLNNPNSPDPTRQLLKTLLILTAAPEEQRRDGSVESLQLPTPSSSVSPPLPTSLHPQPHLPHLVFHQVPLPKTASSPRLSPLPTSLHLQNQTALLLFPFQVSSQQEVRCRSRVMDRRPDFLPPTDSVGRVASSEEGVVAKRRRRLVRRTWGSRLRRRRMEEGWMVPGRRLSGGRIARIRSS